MLSEQTDSYNASHAGESFARHTAVLHTGKKFVTELQWYFDSDITTATPCVQDRDKATKCHSTSQYSFRKVRNFKIEDFGDVRAQ